MSTAVRVRADQLDEILRRLRRVEGQVQGLQRMLTEGRDCADVAQQVAATRAALDRVAIDIIASGMEKCVRMDAEGKPQGRLNMERLRRAFLMLR
jgi:DNA-binding FrmR family transcriptional regulator